MSTNDPVNHPSHYITPSGIEAIDVIEQYGLGYHLGNAMKYLLRAGRKDPAAERQDIEKARWYLRRWRDGKLKGKNGVEIPAASDDLNGGLAWHTPETICAAFGLEGDRYEAVMAILSASAYGNEIECIGEALKALDAILEPSHA